MPRLPQPSKLASARCTPRVPARLPAMAISQRRTGPQATGQPPPAPPPAVDGAEVLALAAVLGVGLLAWAGLVLADAGRYRLLGAAGLAALAMAAIGLVAWRSRPRPRLAVDGPSLAVLLGVGLVAAFL